MVRSLVIAFEGLPGSGKSLLSGYLRGSSIDPYVVIPEISDTPKDFLDPSSRDIVIDGNRWHLDKNIEDLKLARRLKELGFSVGLDRTFISTLSFSKAFADIEAIDTFSYMWKYYQSKKPEIDGCFDVLVYLKLDPRESMRKFVNKSRICPPMQYFNNVEFLQRMSDYFDQFIPTIEGVEVISFNLKDQPSYQVVLNSLRKLLGDKYKS